MAANINTYRVINFGFEVIPIAAAMTNGGYTVVNEVVQPHAAAATFVSPNLISPSNNISSISGEPIAFISRPKGPDAFTQTLQNSSAGSTTIGWSGGRVMVTGANPSTGAVLIRIRANLEVVLNNANYINTGAKPSSANTALTDVVSRVREKIDPIIIGGARAVERRVSQLAMEGLARLAGGAIGAYFGGLPGAMAGQGVAGGGARTLMDLGELD